MSAANYELPADLLAMLRQPPSAGDKPETMEQFFARPLMRVQQQQVHQREQTVPILLACAALLPDLSPQRAAWLALMGGSLVEDGTDPTLLFPVCLQLLEHWLQQLQPFCAGQALPGDEDVSPQDTAHWQATQARLTALTAAQRAEVKQLHEATELLVLPLMTMVLREQRNFDAFIQRHSLQALLHPMECNDSLPFEQLYYLVQVANLSYEDELIVLLPASHSGFVARVHAANNSFHACSMLQDVIRAHGQALGVRPGLLSQPARDWATEDADSALFQWLQASAYADGQLVNAMAWAWGEAPLRSFATRYGKLVLIALDSEGGATRGWNGFTRSCHEAQNPHAEFKRYLNADEVTAFLA